LQSKTTNRFYGKYTQQHTEHRVSSLVRTYLYNLHCDVMLDTSYQSTQRNTTQRLTSSTTQWANNARSKRS